ncbi:family 1 glycosylhydrolase [Streptomyces sp. NPDC047000]|uniref:family 1 glycosylhydrolase n=1 Tax=Streptomyces sp. NPDC047000 TaxID=3155474 RepID=UPI00340551DB
MRASESRAPISHEYGVREPSIAENGSARPDMAHPEGAIGDTERHDHTVGHLPGCIWAACKGASRADCFAWSPPGNSERAYGCDKRFGFVHVDRRTHVRAIRDRTAGTGTRRSYAAPQPDPKTELA